MAKKKSKWRGKVFIFLMLFSIIAFFNNSSSPILTIQAASGTFSEDFSTTTYMDGANTNTTGWGTGEINNIKKKPTIVGSLSSTAIGNALDVFVEGDYAHIVADDSGYQLVNITDLSNPFKISSYNTAGHAMGLHIDGDYVYIADHSNGLVILNITDPSNPQLIGSDYTNDIARDVAVYGDYAYIADSDSGLTVIDISNPTFPSTQTSYAAGGSVYSVDIEGRNAFITNGINLQIIDISNPTSPSLIGSTPCNGAIDVAIDGNTAFVAAQDEGVLIVNITDLNSPQVISFYSDTYSIGIGIDGDFVYTIDLNGYLKVIDVSDLKKPKLGTSSNIPVASQGIFVANENAFVACYTNGLQIFNVKNQVEPSFISSYNTPDRAISAYVSGNLVYVSDYESGLQILNISDPSTPNYVGSYNTLWRTYHIVIDGDYAYISDGQTIQILNVSVPSSPTYLGSYISTGQSARIFVSGDFLFIADYSGLEILDVSNPTTPSSIGFHSTAVYTLGVDVAGDYAYTAVFTDGIQVLDVSDPTTPKVVGSYDTPGSAYEIEVEGDLAYVGDHSGGFLIFDVRDHKNPALIGSCVTPGYALSIFISGNYAYVGDYQGDFLIIDISDPTDPTIVGTYDNPAADTGDLFVHGDYAYVGCDVEGLHIVEISKNKARQYDSPCVAQSTTFYSDNSYTIDSAKLISNAFVPSDTSIKYFLSADNGVHWEQVTNNTLHSFTNIGYQLKWKAELTSQNVSYSPYLYSLEIEYVSLLKAPELYTPENPSADFDYTPTFTWFGINGEIGYLFQLDTSSDFVTPVINITLPSTSTSYTPDTPLTPGDNYWRIAGIDSNGELGLFSGYYLHTILTDSTDPNIDHPSDITYELGHTGNEITWHPTDENPDRYTIRVDGVIQINNANWAGGSITYNVDGYSEGVFGIQCFAYDAEGNYAEDNVQVNVITPESPIIDDVADFEYEAGDTGNYITWHPSDSYPDYYSITRNGLVVDDGPWLGGDIYIDIDGLAYGVYTYVCIVNDTDGLEATDTVIITVTDSVNPNLNSPPYVNYNEGETGNNIIWIATDSNPATYTVYKDGTLFETDTWASGSSIIVSIDGLTTGLYNFTIVVHDQAGNIAKNTVMVDVNPVVAEFNQKAFFSIICIMVVITFNIRKRRIHKKS